MAFTHFMAFDRPLAGAVLPGREPLHTAAELAERTGDAYRRGVADAQAAADQHLVEFRAEMQQLSDGVLCRLAAGETMLLAQVREALPGLAVEIGRRLLAGSEPPAEVIARLCHEALEQLYPEREGLEVALNPRDAELLQALSPDWLKLYPNLRFRADATLRPGDCQVRSRFGLTDARQETKLAALRHHLTGT